MAEELDRAIIDAAHALKIDPLAMNAAVQAVSVTRRGSVEWSQHDVTIAESCLGAFLHVTRTG